MEFRKGDHFYLQDCGTEIEVLEVYSDRLKVVEYENCACCGEKEDWENCNEDCENCEKSAPLAIITNRMKSEFSEKMRAKDIFGKPINQEWFSENPEENKKIFGKPLKIVKR